jgi:hypothetical protein
MSYQLALMTPGTSPLKASIRKQMRHMENFRKKARGRPHSGHRLYFLTLNLGSLLALLISDFFATLTLLPVISP